MLTNGIESVEKKTDQNLLNFQVTKENKKDKKNQHIHLLAHSIKNISEHAM